MRSSSMGEKVAWTDLDDFVPEEHVPVVARFFNSLRYPNVDHVRRSAWWRVRLFFGCHVPCSLRLAANTR